MTRKPHIYRQSLLKKEIGTIRKRWDGSVKIALAYPNQYYVGMSNLGFQTVYRQLNSLNGVICERVFLHDAADPNKSRAKSLESSKPVSDFDIIAFSISFENDYPNLLAILEQAGLPLRSRDRDPHHPLVVAGGVACSLNPEPVAAFVDCFIVGEAEPVLHRFIDCFDPGAERSSNLEKIAREVPGTYVPAFYEAAYRSDGTIAGFNPTRDVPGKINRIVRTDLSDDAAASVILTPNTTFQQTYLVETGRGCPHGCRFCAAGYVYRPPRFVPAETLEKEIQKASTVTDSVGLVGAAVSDHPDILQICRSASRSEIRLSFSSLRADALTSELLSVLKKSGVKTATIAPDAGSERMRDVINKGISEAVVLNAAESLVAHGIPNIKLYFMVGLPTEQAEDVEAIVTLCKRLKHRFLTSSKARKRIGDITVSLSCFVPKPFTPFQWAAMDEIGTLKAKIKRIRQGLKKIPNVRLNADVPRWAYIQALLSRGDRRVARILETAHQNNGNWAKTLKMNALNADFYVYRSRSLDELLPWDFINHGVEKSFLANEYRKSLRAEPTPECRVGACDRCGACGSYFDTENL